MSQEITIVDAFTRRPFSGNPAAVCLLNSPLPEENMRAIAAEMNLSETAFLLVEGAGYRLRWFTPSAEVKLCGHATLASAHVLWEREVVKKDKIEFYTLSGTLAARRVGDEIELDFPVENVSPAEIPPGMLEVLGVTPIFTGRTEVRYFIELRTAQEVRQLKPNFSHLAEFAPGRVVVTARGDSPEFDFISRYFAPGIGIPEDPVTGSTHCALAPYWSKKLGKNSFTAYQASARGGTLQLALDGGRVRLRGGAVTVMRGSLVV